jgi:hypothetical protein
VRAVAADQENTRHIVAGLATIECRNLPPAIKRASDYGLTDEPRTTEH